MNGKYYIVVANNVVTYHNRRKHVIKISNRTSVVQKKKNKNESINSRIGAYAYGRIKNVVGYKNYLIMQKYAK